MPTDKFLRELSNTSNDPLDTDIRHPILNQGVIHTCTHCGRDFIPTRYWNHFCSAACRVAHNNARAPAWKPKLDDLA